MISIKSHFHNKTIFKGIKSLAKNIKKSINISLFGIGKENVRHARKLMLESKSGRIYKINKRDHQAAAPGEAPGIVTKNLFNNVDYIVTGHNQMEFGERVPYGIYQEEGTDKMPAHPFLKPTIKAKQRDAYNEFVRNTNNVLKKMK